MPPALIHRLTHPGALTAATVACGDPRATLATWNVADVTCPACLHQCTCGPGVALCPACRTYNAAHGGRPTTLPPRPLTTEKAFQEAVRRLAIERNYLYYHVYNASNSPSGYPDVTLVKGDMMVLAELKMPGKAPTVAQQRWLEALAQVQTVSTWVWTPADWSLIDEVLR